MDTGALINGSLSLWAVSRPEPVGFGAPSEHYGVSKNELVQLPASEFGVILIEIWVKRGNMSGSVLIFNTDFGYNKRY